jgi:phosphosulfolactate synthase
MFNKEIQGNTAFTEIRIPGWPPKPREAGITMVADWGVGLTRQTDLIQTAGYFVDLAKIVVGISRILPREILAKKIQLYKENQIRAFPGGQFLEIAVLQKRVEEYCAAAQEIGYEYVEVSDNAISIPPKEKSQIIEQAARGGLKGIGEVGKKVATTDVQALARAVDISKLIFEIPLVSVQEVHHFEGYQMWIWLLKTFGPQVNIANVEFDDPLKLAATRLGIGADTSLEGGTFCRSLNGEFVKPVNE